MRGCEKLLEMCGVWCNAVILAENGPRAPKAPAALPCRPYVARIIHAEIGRAKRRMVGKILPRYSYHLFNAGGVSESGPSRETSSMLVCEIGIAAIGLPQLAALPARLSIICLHRWRQL